MHADERAGSRMQGWIAHGMQVRSESARHAGQHTRHSQHHGQDGSDGPADELRNDVDEGSVPGGQVGRWAGRFEGESH